MFDNSSPVTAVSAGAAPKVDTDDSDRCRDAIRSRRAAKPGLSAFSELFRRSIQAHGETAYRLHQALKAAGHRVPCTSLYGWRRGKQYPRDVHSLRALAFIERRYGLRPNALKDQLPNPNRASVGFHHVDLTRAERRCVAWHLPDDFNDRPPAAQAEIVAWLRQNVMTGATPFRRYHRVARKHRFALTFPEATAEIDSVPDPSETKGRRRGQIGLAAPPELDRELRELVRFKMAKITPMGFCRRGFWKPPTAHQMVNYVGLLYGALAAEAEGPIKGAGAPSESLSLALLAIPGVWRWYIEWRHRRRGFYTRWEMHMLEFAASLLKPQTGWLLQSPALANRLRPIAGVVSMAEVTRAQRDWVGACQETFQQVRTWSKDVVRVARVHRDPFLAVLPVLEAPQPVAVYSRIGDEILKRMPDPAIDPVAAAEASRAFLMLRIGLHTGLRQKNLRQLRVGPIGAPPTAMETLEALQCGELFYDPRENGWIVALPAAAFKNATSSYFANSPYRLKLPDRGGLYRQITAYLAVHRPILLGDLEDPKTFFVKFARSAQTGSARYQSSDFYVAWRQMIERYGIYNPFTGRGAIEGLLPHGPHNVRDVLATHIIKRTGSYEQAGFAIQDKPETLARHYARFLAHDKAEIAARILDEVWTEGG